MSCEQLKTDFAKCYEFQLMLKTQRAFDFGVIAEADYQMQIQLLSDLMSNRNKLGASIKFDSLKFYEDFIDKKLDEYYSSGCNELMLAARMRSTFEKYTFKLPASNTDFQNQTTDTTTSASLSSLSRNFFQKNPRVSNSEKTREKCSTCVRQKMGSFDVPVNRLLIEIQRQFENGEISESEYQRTQAILLNSMKNALIIDKSVVNEMVADQLRIYNKAMNKVLSSDAFNKVALCNASEKTQIETTKFTSTVYKLSDQQLADRFLKGNKSNTRPMIQAVKPSFASCVKTLLGSIESMSDTTTASDFNKKIGIQRGISFEKGKGDKKQYRRQKKGELESEDSLFRTAKEQLQNSEFAKGTKPGYSAKKHKSDESELENKYSPEVAEIINDDRGKVLDPTLVEKVLFDIVENIMSITWEDISGLEFAKQSIREIVIFPMLRPDLFTGLRSPCKGLLLFGPPGTGKTLIGKCIASESESTFFSISASSLTSKYVGEGEKMVRTLFTIARIKQPSVIFIDEIDSLLTHRSDSEHEASRRLKTEFLVQFDGLTTEKCEQLLVVGATNRPQELDEAARRRFVKRLYIPLPTKNARKEIITHLMKNENNSLTEEDIYKLCILTDGYSGSDVTNLCKEAALGPIRKIGCQLLKNIKESALPPISISDFMVALKVIKASVSNGDLEVYDKFNDNFGAVAVPKDESEEMIA